MTVLDDATRKAYEGNIRKFTLFEVLVQLHLWLPIWIIYLRDDRGLSLDRILAMEGPFWVALVLLEVPTGAVADRYGRRASLAAGAAVYAAALLVFGIADSYPVIFASYLLWAAAMTLMSGADGAFFYDTLQALGRQEEYARLWGRIRALVPVTTGLAMLVGAPLAQFTTLNTPILVSAGVLGVAFLVALTFREPPVHHEGEGALGFVANSRKAASIAWRDRRVRYMIIFSGVIVGTAASADIFAQPFLDRHDVSVGFFGLLLLPGTLAAAAGSLFAYRAVSVLGLRLVVALLPVVIVGMIFAIAAWDSVIAIILFPLIAMSSALAMPLVSDYVNRRVPSSQRATILSFQSLGFSLILAGSLPIMGAVAESNGIPFSFGVLGLVVIPALLGALILWLRADRSPEAAAPVVPDEPDAVPVPAA